MSNLPEIEQIRAIQSTLQDEKIRDYKRRVSFGDLLTDRWENARQYGFEEGSSIYDNALVIGNVKVGRQTWIGPNTVLDGSGGLEIGEYCQIGPGVQIFTHNHIRWSLTRGKEGPERKPTKIGNGVFIAANSVIMAGITIGDDVVIGALSFVNKDVPTGTIVAGTPARQIGLSASLLDD
ncbi:acyltransferase [Microvirga solisilvae]|uniref:acyltransferase n=1 Tax=Microvirga solisilvae TaxID=2919498 RepID=UPI001FAFF493|nr:acyltransferase [Microvirga solisilvae]